MRTAAIECLNQLGDDIVSDYAPMIAAQMHYDGDGAASWKVRNAACPCCAPLEAGHFLLDQFAGRTGLRGLFRAQVPRALRPRARRGFWLAPWNARL